MEKIIEQADVLLLSCGCDAPFITFNTIERMRSVKFKESSKIEQCPKCGNKTEFNIHSQQVSEDCCEVWAVCKCGFDSTQNPETFRTDRLEDVWGGCNDDNCYGAIGVWNDQIKELNSKQNAQESDTTEAK